MIDCAFCPDFAPVPLNDPLHCCQADSRATNLRLIVATVEGTEQLLGPRHVESSSVVPHKISPRTVGLGQCAKFDPRARPFGGELPGVAEQILEHDSKQPGVTLNIHP